MRATRLRDRHLGILLLTALGGGLIGACAGDTGPEGPAGADGVGCEVTQTEDATTITCGDTSVTVPSGSSCVVVDDGGGATITCDDGSTASVTDGEDGDDGAPGAAGDDGDDGTSCTVEVVDETTSRISCDDGTEVLVTDGETGDTGEQGPTGDDGLDAGQTPGLQVTLAADVPERGYYEVGETITVTATVMDGNGDPIAFDELTTPALYLNGPRELLLNRARVELIGASTDRSARPHHYIDLTAGADGVVYDGNTVSFTTAAVSDEEEDGTYTFNVRVSNVEFPLDQVQPTLDIQIGTDEVEPIIVDGCADCHQGTNGQLYLHHVDPGRSPWGSPAIDSAPPVTCYACHTTDGYAAYSVDGVRYPDPIVFRVHGVHNGANLLTEERIALFEDYEEVEFPADITNCQACHADDDDSWYTQPSALACGSCHDRVDWETGDYIVPNGDLTAHPGGAEDSGTPCTTCHGADTGLAPIRPAHESVAATPPYNITIELSPPDTGSFYVDEEPTLTIQFLDSTTGAAVDPAGFGPSYQRAQLFVYGPRENPRPVLTTVATATGSSYQYTDLRLDGSGMSSDLLLTRTETAWQYALLGVEGLEPGTYFIAIRARAASGVPYSKGFTTFQVGTAAVDEAIATDCTRCHDDGTMHGWAPFDTQYCIACHDYNRSYDASTGWEDHNYGFGTPPLSRIVHEVHFGHYLQNNDEFESIIFPQDVRNCETCHAESDDWQTEPNRTACGGCHDATDVQAHMILMTVDRTPEDGYSGDELESCGTCHGPGAEFSVWDVHNVQDPYRPPYAR